jgi:hypothetical protein
LSFFYFLPSEEIKQITKEEKVSASRSIEKQMNVKRSVLLCNVDFQNTDSKNVNFQKTLISKNGNFQKTYTSKSPTSKNANSNNPDFQKCRLTKYQI